jgi:hypothetical protein
MTEAAKSAAVAQFQPTPAPAPVVNVTDGIMAQILRVASDPSIDLDRMDKLMAMHERLQKDQAERAFAAALAELQGDLPLVAQGGYDSHKKIAYSRLEDVLLAARPAMQRHGFSISFDVVHEPGAVVVTGMLTHSAGHSRKTTGRYPVDTGPGRSAIQALGSSETYGRRYVMMSLLNIASDKDDDGATPEGRSAARRSASEEQPKLITEKQVDDLRDLLQSLNRSEARFCAHKRISHLGEIHARHFNDIVVEVEKAGAKS